ncbi:HesB/YadR/YfhF family protein [Metabacillus sp. RGM 3146]|uniref:HesB/YadR/YfhF family protein n=1 Tax=Metabacillus sp. RGM 3146 TaxID=3401092 RepID=UPI003B9B3B9B
MKLKVSNKAASWYKEELDLNDGDSLRFFVRYGGNSTIQSGFSLGVINDTPKEAAAMAEANGLTFFVEESDVWYFDQYDLQVNVKEDGDEPEFHYEKTAE